jgi:hypothetical protein
MKTVGLIGWRGMVGSVLMGRMREERDFDHIDPVFFTTSNPGGKGPDIGKDVPPLKDAMSVDELKAMDIIITCQGGDYTKDMYPKLMRRRLERLLDRRRLGAAHEGRGDHHPRPGEQERHPGRHQEWRQDLRRRQLHGVADAHGHRRPVRQGPGGMDRAADLSGRVRRRARATCANCCNRWAR